LLSALVPFRSYILERLFKQEDMEHLDPSGESEQEYAEEQRAIHRVARSNSFDSEEIHIPSRAEFRSKGLQKAIREQKRHLDENPEPEAKDVLIDTKAIEAMTEALDAAESRLYPVDEEMLTRLEEEGKLPTEVKIFPAKHMPIFWAKSHGRDAENRYPPLHI
jgi:cobalamin-dependent methionine synthase I